jgi:hypothetical protein
LLGNEICLLSPHTNIKLQTKQNSTKDQLITNASTDITIERTDDQYSFVILVAYSEERTGKLTDAELLDSYNATKQQKKYSQTVPEGI